MVRRHHILRIYLFYLVAFCFFQIDTHAQVSKRQELLDFYRKEQQSWMEYIERYPMGVSPSNFDVTFYHIDVEVGIESPYIQGNVRCRFLTTENSVDVVDFNLYHALSIDSITGDVDHFDFENDTIHVYLDRTFNIGDTGMVTITYRGVPELAGGYKGLRYETHGNNEPVIATLSTPFLAHYWWPCKDGPGDKPDSVYIDVTIPDTTINGIPLTVSSNGVLENIIIEDGKKKFQWREQYPIVPYYVMLAVSNYQTLNQQYTGGNGEQFPLDYWVFGEDLTDAQEGVTLLPDVIDFFSDCFGPYPFRDEKYGMTQIGFYGGIENQTNTIINNMSVSMFFTAVHELAHMWFGDMITCADWHHGWLNEGFAVYCEALWAEHIYGDAAYHTLMSRNKFLTGGTLYLQDDSDFSRIFISIIYRKGSWALHMLRGVLGDALFFECLRTYANHPDFMYDHATTEDFQGVCEEVSGMDLDFFFDQWIYDEYYPKYEVNLNQDGLVTGATVTIRQTQGDEGWRSVFEMPVQISFNFMGGGDTLVTVWNDQQVQDYVFQFERPIENMSLDPNWWILKEIEQGIVDPVPQRPIPLYNLPNPFNESTIISYWLPSTRRVTLKIFNLNGKEIRTLIDHKSINIGNHQVIWDGSDRNGEKVASGIYVCQLLTGDVIETKKMILLK